MASFIVSSFGTFVMVLFAGLLTPPSQQTLMLLACGKVRAGRERQTISTYLWLTGATSVKHFSRFYAFLGGALYQGRWQLWARIIKHAARRVPPEAPIVLEVDDSTLFGPAAKLCMAQAFLRYLGLSPGWPKILQSPTSLSRSPHRARN